MDRMTMGLIGSLVAMLSTGCTPKADPGENPDSDPCLHYAISTSGLKSSCSGSYTYNGRDMGKIALQYSMKSVMGYDQFEGRATVPAMNGGAAGDVVVTIDDATEEVRYSTPVGELGIAAYAGHPDMLIVRSQMGHGPVESHPVTCDGIDAFVTKLVAQHPRPADADSYRFPCQELETYRDGLPVYQAMVKEQNKPHLGIGLIHGKNLQRLAERAGLPSMLFFTFVRVPVNVRMNAIIGNNQCNGSNAGHGNYNANCR